MIKERPILFSAPMVRAILEGRKTVTRRVMKPQPHPDFLARGVHSVVPQWPNQDGVRWFMEDGCSELVKCPHGKPGDRLWVRESFWGCDLPGHGDQPCVVYDDEWHGKEYEPAETRPWARKFGRIPSIHMPRNASRILLEITAVRVERLQDGEGETAFESRYLAEGIHRIHHGDGDYHYHAFRNEPGPGNWVDPFDAWRELWQSINGPGSWDANPWVWAVSFRAIQSSQEHHHD